MNKPKRIKDLRAMPAETFKKFHGMSKSQFMKKHVQEEVEQMNEEKDKREYDYEGEMVKSDLRSIIANANRLIDMLGDDDNLPEWCQNKVTLAEDYISTVANYMTAEMNEEVQLDEKNVPTSPEKWARAKAMAKSKFDVYPSAYANGWAAKKYKEMGGGWKSVSEAYNTMSPSSYDDHPMVAFRKKENEKKKEEPPFEPTKPKKSALAGKYGIGYSTAKHLAKMGMKKQKLKEQHAEKGRFKPVEPKMVKSQPVVSPRPKSDSANVKLKEEVSRKTSIVRSVAKKAMAAKTDKFQKDPELGSTITKDV